MEILFYRRAYPAQKKKGTCTIQCRVTVDGERAELGSTGIEVLSEHFQDQKITHADPLYQLHNLKLQEEYVTQVLAIYNDLVRRKKVITAEKIKKIFFDPDAADDEDTLGLIEGFNLFLADFEGQTKVSDDPRKQKEPPKSSSSLKPLKNCRNKLQNYLNRIEKPNVQIGELDIPFFEDYERYMYLQLYEQSYINKQLKTLAQVTRWLKRKKHIKVNPFVDIEVGREQIKDPHYLTQEQFQKWCSFRFRNKHAQQVADIFILYCRTAFHYQDLKQVILEPDKYIRKGLDGQMWIYKPRQKTKEVAKIPIDAFKKVIRPIVKKYKGWENLPITSNKDLNEWLKLCVAEINLSLPKNLQIYEGLSVKHGRTTFCHWWINELGRTKESLLPIMGRTSDYGLDRYVRPDERAIISALTVRKTARVKKAG